MSKKKEPKEVFKTQVAATLVASEREFLNATINRLPVISEVFSQKQGLLAMATFLNTFMDKVEEIQQLEQSLNAGKPSETVEKETRKTSQRNSLNV